MGAKESGIWERNAKWEFFQLSSAQKQEHKMLFDLCLASFETSESISKLNFALGLKNLMLTQHKFGNPFTVFMSYIGHEILLKR